uniref:Uncharacterized protein n=1 Tax=Anguilla anguilla TaxID=7936 RepID=A0A0E9RH00_ANGAN
MAQRCGPLQTEYVIYCAEILVVSPSDSLYLSLSDSVSVSVSQSVSVFSISR